MTSTLQDVLRSKGGSVVTCPRDASVADAAAAMAHHRIGSVVAVDCGSAVGLVTERDMLIHVLLAKRDPATARLSDILSAKPAPIVASPSMPVLQAMGVMTRTGQRHLPVSEGGQLRGVVSVGDLLHHITRVLGEQVVDMTLFVHGPYTIPEDALIRELASQQGWRRV